MIKLLIGAVLAAVVVLVSFSFISPLVTNSASSSSSQTTTTSENTFSVAIEGEVNKTGTYVLSSGATMQNLIDAAGGITSNADERTYYTTSVLTSGKTYFIGSKVDSTDICSSKEITKVNINTSVATTLTKINGFTTSIAESVVSYRNTNGDFTTLEGILDVYGIGNATYRKVRNYIYLHE